MQGFLLGLISLLIPFNAHADPTEGDLALIGGLLFLIPALPSIASTWLIRRLYRNRPRAPGLKVFVWTSIALLWLLVLPTALIRGVFGGGDFSFFIHFFYPIYWGVASHLCGRDLFERRKPIRATLIALVSIPILLTIFIHWRNLSSMIALDQNLVANWRLWAP